MPQWKERYKNSIKEREIKKKRNSKFGEKKLNLKFGLKEKIFWKKKNRNKTEN